MKKKIVWLLVALIVVGGSLGFYLYYRHYQQLVANNEAGICAETGTILSKQELRARVAENLLWQMLQETDADKNQLINRSIAVVNRNIGKDEIIAMIENSSGKQFIHDITNDPGTVLFTYGDTDIKAIDFFATLLFGSYRNRIKHYPILTNKMAKVRTMFDGDFSLVSYNNRYAYRWYTESHDGGYGRMSIISGDSIFLNNDDFSNKYDDFSVSGNEVNYIVNYNNKPIPISRTRVNKSIPDDHAYGRFFYQYYSNGLAIGYDNLYLRIGDEEERKEKIREEKDKDINRISKQYPYLIFLAVSNCGDILEYYTESPASGYLVVDHF
jgi:hypothetical protein